MKNEIEFKSASELYRRLLPALKSRAKMLTKEGYSYITEKHIWEYLKINIWLKESGLELCEMVDDILHEPTENIFTYYQNLPKEKESFIIPKKDLQDVIVNDLEIELPKLK